MNSFLLQFEEENVQEETKLAVSEVFEVLERKSSLSLNFPLLRPSVRFEPRSKAVLRGEGYAWTSIW